MKKYILITFLIAVLISFILPFQFLLNFAHDDSFFYIKTANNFSKGSGSTFDGINFTNGYHPLYFILLAVIFSLPNLLFKAPPEWLFRLVVLIHLIMIIGIQVFVVKSIKNIFDVKIKKSVIILLTILFTSLIFIRDFGLESHLGCLIISFFLFIKSKEITENKNYIFIKSIIIAGLFLTRTDYLYSFIPMLLLIDCFLSSERKKYLVTTLSVLFLAVIMYYLSNLVFFGSINTVSGKLLNGFPDINFKNNINILLSYPEKLYNQFVKILFSIFVTSIFCVFYLRSKNINSNTKGFLLVILSLGIGGVVFVLLHLLFNKYSIREWYMTPPIFITVIVIIILFLDKKYMINISLLLSIILLILIFYNTRIKNMKFNSAYEYSKTLNSLVGENDIIYQVDFCGVIGFFSERKVVDGDGLINSFEYIDYLTSGKIDDYISRYNIKYYSTYSYKNIFRDSIYIDDSFSDIIKGKKFIFQKNSLVIDKPFESSHIAFDLKGNWYLFKLQ